MVAWGKIALSSFATLLFDGQRVTGPSIPHTATSRHIPVGQPLFSAGRSHVKRDNLLQQLRLTVTTFHTNPPISSYLFISFYLRVPISEKYEHVSNYSHIMSNQDLVIGEPTMTSCNMARWTPWCQRPHNRCHEAPREGRKCRTWWPWGSATFTWYPWKKYG